MCRPLQGQDRRRYGRWGLLLPSQLHPSELVAREIHRREDAIPEPQVALQHEVCAQPQEELAIGPHVFK